MEVRLITRPLKTNTTSPLLEAVRYAQENGFELRREPFGRRGSLIEIYRNGEDLGYRKGYAAALNLMRKHAAAQPASPAPGTTAQTSAQHAPAAVQVRAYMDTRGAAGRHDFAAGLAIAAQFADQQAAEKADKPDTLAQALEISAELHAKARTAELIARKALPRADRIRRLITRIDARLTDLRFAESLSYAAAYKATQTGSDATAACAHHLAVRAIRATDTLQRRAVRLSHAELRALQTAAE